MTEIIKVPKKAIGFRFSVFSSVNIDIRNFPQPRGVIAFPSSKTFWLHYAAATGISESVREKSLRRKFCSRHSRRFAVLVLTWGAIFRLFFFHFWLCPFVFEASKSYLLIKPNFLNDSRGGQKIFHTYN